MENSTKEGNAAPAPERLKPEQDGFYQLGYRHALTDVIETAAIALILYGLVQLLYPSKVAV